MKLNSLKDLPSLLSWQLILHFFFFFLNTPKQLCYALSKGNQKFNLDAARGETEVKGRFMDQSLQYWRFKVGVLFITLNFLVTQIGITRIRKSKPGCCMFC